MRLVRRAHFVRGFSLAAMAAAIAVVSTAEAAAQFGGRGKGYAPGRAGFATQRAVPAPNVSRMPRAATMPSAGSKYPGRAGLPQRSAATKPTHPEAGGTRRPPRMPTGPVVGERVPPHDGGVRPPRPGWPNRPGYGPIVGPGVVIGSGVAIGTGVAIGSAVAAPPPPPQFGGSGGSGAGGPPLAGPAINVPPANEQRFIPNEVVLEFAGNVPAQAIADLARRHRLARLDQLSLANTNSTYFRVRIADGRPVRAVLAGLRGETALRAGQPNYLYLVAQPASDAAATFTPPEPATPQPVPAAAAAGALPAQLGDPAQYALTKLRLQEAHGLTRGNNVLVAVIDSGIDASHPELRGVIAGTFDALQKTEKPHVHGTAMAGTIAARSRLSGVAPAARILAIRAFGASGGSVEANTFAVLKSIDHAMGQNARIINMSFAGPADPGFARALAAAHARGIVLVAAAGNFGAKAPPQYPAADPNVIAVSATDANDRLFAASNRGNHIAVAAPGVDILVAVPGPNYDLTSGTSVAAAHVSGVVALILERQPSLSPDAVRRILLATAKDLGPAGRDDQFGAGLADAYGALLAIESRAVAAPANAPGPSAR